MTLRTPPHWPKDVVFLKASKFHSSVSTSTKTFIQPSPGKSQCSGDNSGSQVIIRVITDPAHPAFGQFGLFSAKKIAAKTHIIDYIGEIHVEERPDSNYDLSLHRFQDGMSVGIDASKMGNEARFINDFRGVKQKPNAIFVDGRDINGELRMSIWSNSTLKRGEEILVSYGRSWWREREK
ncbi:SET domain protein [Hymenopellis radicata]|nr:SET domain protein [Hymenopellis radicata]